MSRPTDPLRLDHLRFAGQVDAIRAAADGISDTPGPDVPAAVRDVLGWLRGELAAHARAEEAVLYPAVAAALGSPDATRTMVEDHRRLRTLTDELTPLADAFGAGPLSLTQLTSLRRVLYGLHALVSIHLLKEEEVYLPILDAALTADEAEELYAEMQEAEGAPALLSQPSRP